MQLAHFIDSTRKVLCDETIKRIRFLNLCQKYESHTIKNENGSNITLRPHFAALANSQLSRISLIISLMFLSPSIFVYMSLIHI